MLAVSAWLSPWYQLPQSLLVCMGIGNLAYAAFSFSLARRTVRPRALLVTLVAANATWALLCAFAALLVSDRASAFGMAHLVVESLFVGTLAGLEWRYRDLLLVAA